MNIGIDVDDVLTDALSGVMEVNPKWDGTRWDGGLTEEEVIAHWAKVGEVGNFWGNLKPLPTFDLETEELLYQAHFYHDLYFITNRFVTPGSSPLKQTKYWLMTHTCIKAANVIIAKNKGPVAKLLQLDYFFDDRPQNCQDVFNASDGKTKVYLCNAKHNQDSKYILRLDSLKEFLKLVLEAK